MSRDAPHEAAPLTNIEELEIAEWVHVANEWREALVDAEKSQELD